MSWTVPSSGRGSDSRHSAYPLARNPPGKSVSNGCFRIDRSGDAGEGRTAAAASTPPGASHSAGRGCARSACAPPGPTVRTSRATRRTRCPDGEFAQEPGQAFCRAGEGGWFPLAGTADLFWSCPCGGARSPRAPQHCARRRPEEPQKPLETLAVPAPCLSAVTGKMTEIHKHPQKAATRSPLPSGGLFI